MIEKILIFENSGICLFSKSYLDSSLGDEDELMTGFLSVLFGYLDSQFGNLQFIRTHKNILLINRIEEIYVCMIITRIQTNREDFEVTDRNTLLHKRLENACKSLLLLVERKVGTLLIQLKIRQEKNVNYRSIFAEIEADIDLIIQNGQRKIQVIRKVFENNPIANALEI